jgi:uncharacterized Zn finger protein
MSATSLAQILTLRRVKALASARSFARGREYYEDGVVGSVAVSNDTLHGTVIGTEEYKVRLAVKNEALDHYCSCPFAAKGEFCKHCVAVALAWLEPSKKTPEPSNAPGVVVKLGDVHPWLLSQEKETLANLLLEAATEHDLLRERLLRAVAKASGKALDFRVLRNAIKHATAMHDFSDWREVGSVCQDIQNSIAPLEGMLKDGYANEVIDLTEYALSRMGDNVLKQIDDSDAEICDIIETLQDLHFAACEVARPNPLELAKRLFLGRFRAIRTFFTAQVHATRRYSVQRGWPVTKSWPRPTMRHKKKKMQARTIGISKRASLNAF